MPNVMEKGSLFIISAPSGAGKTTLVQALVKSMDNITVSISHTTRTPRTEERTAHDYHFVNNAEFHSMIAGGKFLEYAEIYGHFYGSVRAYIEEMLIKGIDVILEIDWQGARQVRAQWMEVVSIFILPPSIDILQDRLQKRHAATESDIVTARMKTAKNELAHYNEYDYLVCNDNFDQALLDLQSIVRAKRLEWHRQVIKFDSLIKALIS